MKTRSNLYFQQCNITKKSYASTKYNPNILCCTDDFKVYVVVEATDKDCDFDLDGRKLKIVLTTTLYKLEQTTDLFKVNCIKYKKIKRS